LISIRKSCDELDNLEELKKCVAQKNELAMRYAFAIQSVAEYAVEIDATPGNEFRANLRRLASAVECATSSSEYEIVQSSFRGELRKFRDDSAQRLDRMRSEMSAAATAMQALAEGVTENGAGLESRIRQELFRLANAAASDDLEYVHEEISTAAAGLEQSYQELERRNQLAVAQLQDEIRSLHAELAQERRAIFTDRISGLWVRPKLDSRIEDLLLQPEPFWVLLVRYDLRRIDVEYSTSQVKSLLKAMAGRLTGTVPRGAMVGRWSYDTFAAVIETDPETEGFQDVDYQSALGCYSIQEDGLALSIPVQVSAVRVGRLTGSSASSFYINLGRASESLSHGTHAAP
jgi:GGDEF domain-containing protein